MQEELEESFKSEISPILLHFKDSEIEHKYRAYKFYDKSTPKWVSWLMWSLVAMIIIRKLELYIFSFYHLVADASSATVQLAVLLSLLGAAIIELIIIYSKRLPIIRGFTVLVAMFFMVNYNSFGLNATKVSLNMLYFFRFNSYIVPLQLLLHPDSFAIIILTLGFLVL